MQFGHFLYPMKFDDAHDDQAIDDCLYEAELAEALGLDAVWLAEHHFEALVGSPKRVAEQIAQLRDMGAKNLMLTHRGLVSPQQAASSLRLLSEKIMPQFT